MAAPALVVGDYLGGPGTGALGGPPIEHNYKRAVFRPAPSNFSVDVLPATKFGSGYCYGMRIHPIQGSELPDDKSGKSSRSGQSMHSEYDVWRRWEDCLWFQDILESEYSLMARTKRQRLAAGKGVKKNGMYIHSDQAASFESLPPGPEASSIAKDIHEIVPKLTKKGTIFRASQSTVDQRAREFKAMIETLWSDEVPTLIKELRDTRQVRDFFGYWRRDKDHDKKTNPRSSSSTGDRNSVSESTTSMYFSASNLSLQIPSSPSTLKPNGSRPSSASSRENMRRSPVGGSYARSNSTASSSSASSASPVPRSPGASTPMQFSVNHRGSLAVHSPTSDDDTRSMSSSRSPSSLWLNRTPSKQSSMKDRSSTTSVGIEEVPFVLMSGGEPWSENGVSEPRGLESLPEDAELVPAMSRMTTSSDNRPPARRPRNNSCPDQTNRNGFVFVPPSANSSEDGHAGMLSADANYARFSQADSLAPNTIISSRPSSMTPSMFSEFSQDSSWRSSVASDTTFATGISSFTRDSCDEPPSPTSMYSNSSYYSGPRAARASIATINSVMSGSSVDAVLPKDWSSSPFDRSLRRSLSAESRRPPSVMSDMTLPAEESWNEQQDEFIDAYFYDPTLRSISPAESTYTLAREEMPKEFNQDVSTPERFPKPFQDRPPGQFHLPWSVPESPTPSTATSIRSPTGPDTFTIKVMLDEAIVLLRATHSMSFLVIRERIREKFAKHEGVNLPETFVMAYIPPGDRARLARGRARSNSCSTFGAVDNSQPLRYISSDEEWQTAIASSAAKLTVRIFHNRQ